MQADDDYARYYALVADAQHQLTRARIESWIKRWQNDIRPESEAELRVILERA